MNSFDVFVIKGFTVVKLKIHYLYTFLLLLNKIKFDIFHYGMNKRNITFLFNQNGMYFLATALKEMKEKHLNQRSELLCEVFLI